MKLFTQILCFLACCPMLFAQDGFKFTSHKSKIKIPFKFINNLIIIPIEVNGVELNFLLDTGVEETILFSLDEKEEVKLFDVQKIKLKGLGSEDAIEGLKSSNNKLVLHGLESNKHDIFIVLDQEFNFSSSLGIAVNGIIGYHFFKNNLIEINYSKRNIYIYNEEKVDLEKLLRRYKEQDISIEKAKPYIETMVTVEDTSILTKCLIDTGNSDAVWLFESKSDKIIIPSKNFEDFLGRGFSGSIHGKRAKILKLGIADYNFENPISSFPDSISIRNVKMVENRLGSVGGELLKRFNIIFDYKNEKLYLKRNRNFDEPFRYNISGIDIYHIGLQWVKEITPLKTQLSINVTQESHYTQKESPDFKYNFKLTPVYEILSVRKNSPAEKAGLKKGDIIVSVNNKSAYKLSLQEINTLLRADAGSYLAIIIKRDEKEIRFRFRVEEVL